MKILLCSVLIFKFLSLVHTSHVVPVIKVVSEQVFVLGEGPYYDGENEILYQVDILGGYAVRIDLKTGNVQKIYRGARVSIIIPYADLEDTFIITHNNQLLKLHWTTEESEVIAVVAPEKNGLEKFNDAKCDPRGRLFIGTFLHNEKLEFVPRGGSLYRLDGNTFTKLASEFTVSNGLAWSNDENHTKLYFVDSIPGRIYKFDYEIDTGSIKNQEMLVECLYSEEFVAGEVPDGMLIDKFGYLWVSMYGGGRIVKIDVDTGRVVDQVVLKPHARVSTSVAWGAYQGVDGIFVTTVSADVPADERVDDGKTLHVSFQGGEVYKFKPC